MTTITLPRAVVEQALDSINELFTAEQSEGGERSGHIRTPATREHLVRIAQARKALHESCGALRAALAESGRDWSLLDATQESLREHMAEIQRLRAALAQQDEPVEPVAWKQGNLVTFNEDPYPALGGLFVQFWDGEEVAARVYANDLETLRQRCAKINTAPPQRTMVPLTEEGK